MSDRVCARAHLTSDTSRAWLAVVAGNLRARAFYEKRGWRDVGPFDYQAETDDGPIDVPCRRYELDLSGRS